MKEHIRLDIYAPVDLDTYEQVLRLLGERQTLLTQVVLDPLRLAMFETVFARMEHDRCSPAEAVSLRSFVRKHITSYSTTMLLPSGEGLIVYYEADGINTYQYGMADAFRQISHNGGFGYALVRQARIYTFNVKVKGAVNGIVAGVAQVALEA